jgi:hypothetical protein
VVAGGAPAVPRPRSFAPALAAYRSAERFVLPDDVDPTSKQRVIDYRRRGGVVQAVLLAPPGVPAWAEC